MLRFPSSVSLQPCRSSCIDCFLGLSLVTVWETATANGDVVMVTAGEVAVSEPSPKKHKKSKAERKKGREEREALAKEAQVTREAEQKDLEQLLAAEPLDGGCEEDDLARLGQDEGLPAVVTDGMAALTTKDGGASVASSGATSFLDVSPPKVPVEQRPKVDPLAGLRLPGKEHRGSKPASSGQQGPAEVKAEASGPISSAVVASANAETDAGPAPAADC